MPINSILILILMEFKSSSRKYKTGCGTYATMKMLLPLRKKKYYDYIIKEEEKNLARDFKCIITISHFM